MASFSDVMSEIAVSPPHIEALRKQYGSVSIYVHRDLMRGRKRLDLARELKITRSRVDDLARIGAQRDR